ncbi:unnamed protein product, partial [Prorocentrum cordatum]
AMQDAIDGLMAEALEHQDLCAEMRREQMDRGRFFLHEAPRIAMSWRTKGIRDFLVRSDAFRVANGQPDGSVKDVTVQGRAGWMTNSLCVAKELAQFQCRIWRGGHRRHRHPLDGKAKRKAYYPPALVETILRGFEAQVLFDKMASGMGISHGTIFDDVIGAQLPPEKVAQARGADIEFLRSFPVYKPVDPSEADGHEVIDTRWGDVSNGDHENASVRSRLCAKEFKWNNPWLEDTFAGAPPWGGVKMVLDKTMTKAKSPSGGFKIKKVLILDISGAHIHPLAKRELFTRVPSDGPAGEGGKIGLLPRRMHGARGAAAGWGEHRHEKLALAGYKSGVSCPCAFANSDGSSSGVVHGNDFVFEGEEQQLDAMERESRKHMQVQRTALLGPDASDDKRATIHDRLISYVDGSFSVKSRIAMGRSPSRT